MNRIIRDIRIDAIPVNDPVFPIIPAFLIRLVFGFTIIISPDLI